MEVHHHPKVEKKNFKEYLLEFLMIFLAVTLGFFAENIREHINRSKDIKQSIHSMISDLKSDSIMYQSLLSGNEISRYMDDTLLAMLADKSLNTNHIYFLARDITASLDFVRPNTKTFEQLKSSGAFQFIENENVLDSIASYYQSLKWFDKQNDILLNKLDQVHEANGKLFNTAVFDKIFSNDYTSEAKNTVAVHEPGNNPPLLSYDSVVINSVMMSYHYLGSVLEKITVLQVLHNNNAIS